MLTVLTRHRHNQPGAHVEILVWIGGGLSLAGFFGLLWCVWRVISARRKATNDDELRAVLQGVLPYNMGALGLSVIGLMLIMIGFMLS